MNKNKLCINPGAIATSLVHSFLFLFPFMPGRISPLHSSLPSPTMVTFYRPNLKCDANDVNDKCNASWVSIDVRAGHAGCKVTCRRWCLRCSCDPLEAVHQWAVGSRRRDPSWTVVHSDVRSYYEWCQTTCFLSSEEGRVISAPRLCSFGLSTQSKRLTRVQPSYCPQSVHHSDRRSFTLSVNIYAVKAPHSSGKNYISHQPLCFSLSARRILLPLSHDGMIVFTRFTTELSLLAENHWYWS